MGYTKKILGILHSYFALRVEWHPSEIPKLIIPDST